ncbi:MAG: hypothetical protein H7A21_05490 [Spirochaetales bacterium]|nr:hypothetical protein [Leptospiraceae bacterium]MCP5480868.1 hypothetical protein [Spirochaetales bacterium]
MKERMMRLLDGIQSRTRRWGLREWLPVGLVVQLLALLLYSLIAMLWFGPEASSGEISLSPEMSFIEFQEVSDVEQAQSRDLSEEVVEVDRPEQEEEINWQNAVDPSLDPNQIYVARLDVRTSTDDYPGRARRANLGRVTVAVSLYISADGRIRDVRIRNIRSTTGGHEIYESDFIAATRRVFLTQARLIGSPYRTEGEARDFQWDTTITFTLQ